MFPSSIPLYDGAESSSECIGEQEKDVDIDSLHEGEQLDGKLAPSKDEDKLANSVLDVDLDHIDEGMLVDAAFNSTHGTFMPDMMFKDMVRNFKNAKKLYGETFIRQVSGYDPRFIEKNIRVPEFQRELEKAVEAKASDLQEKGLLKKGGKFTDQALLTAALCMIDQEFERSKDKLSDLGEQVHVAADTAGEKSSSRPYKKGDVFNRVDLKRSLQKALRRGRRSLAYEDLESFDREARQKVNIVYALDCSGSMKGKKLSLAKKAGVALAHRAMKDRNKVGLVLFDKEVRFKGDLSSDLLSFVRPLVEVLPGNETDLAVAIKEARSILFSAKGIKHIVLLSDGVHTTTARGKQAVLDQVLQAKTQDMSISIVGIRLDDEGFALAREIVDLSNGSLLAANDLDEVGGLVIADYMSLLS